jgi:hypothetical protein
MAASRNDPNGGIRCLLTKKIEAELWAHSANAIFCVTGLRRDHSFIVEFLRLDGQTERIVCPATQDIDNAVRNVVFVIEHAINQSGPLDC